MDKIVVSIIIGIILLCVFIMCSKTHEGFAKDRYDTDIFKENFAKDRYDTNIFKENFYSYDTARVPYKFNHGVSKLYGQTYIPGDSIYNTPTKYKGYPLWNRKYGFGLQNLNGYSATDSYFRASGVQPIMYLYP